MSVLFQSSVYQAFIYQLDQLIQSNDNSDAVKNCTQLYHHTIVSDKLLLLGVNISKPIDFKGEDEEFIRSMDDIKEGIDIGYTVLYDGNELPVLSGTSYNSIIKQQLITKYLSNKHYSRSPDNVIITAVTKINISDNFHGLPLQLRVIVSYPLHHQRLFPNKYRRTAQQREIDIRQLLDISKYPLPKTLSKSMFIPIIIAVPVDVKVIVRSLTLDTSLLFVSIMNAHETAYFKIFSFDLQLERTSYKLASELESHSHHYLDQINIMNSLHYRDLFDIVLMNQDNNCNHEYITLPSKETYTIAYKVSIKKPHYLESYIQRHHHATALRQKDLFSYGSLIRFSVFYMTIITIIIITHFTDNH
jgi:hypothetical protein